MIDPGKQTNSLQGTLAAEAFRARTEKAQSDLLYVLEYLAQRPAQRKEEHVKEEEIEAAAELCSKPMDQLSDAEKKRIWSLIDALSHKIAPATVEGLRQCKENRTLPRSLRRGLVVLLITTVIIHIYALFGIQTLNAIDSKSREEFAQFEQMNRMHEADPSLLPKPAGGAQSAASGPENAAGAKTTGVNAVYTHLANKADAIASEKRTHYQSLYQWNAPWAAPISWLNGQSLMGYWGCECLDGRGPCPAACGAGSPGQADRANIQVRYGSESIARSLTLDLQILLLPILYSMLGAGVWLLRDHQVQVSERRLRPVQLGEYAQRILLGAVLGGIVGALYSTDDLKSQLGSLPLLGCAFLVGYNVELVFSLLDRIIAAAQQKPAARAGVPAVKGS